MGAPAPLPSGALCAHLSSLLLPSMMLQPTHLPAETQVCRRLTSALGSPRIHVLILHFLVHAWEHVCAWQDGVQPASPGHGGGAGVPQGNSEARPGLGGQ